MSHLAPSDVERGHILSAAGREGDALAVENKFPGYRAAPDASRQALRAGRTRVDGITGKAPEPVLLEPAPAPFEQWYLYRGDQDHEDEENGCRDHGLGGVVQSDSHYEAQGGHREYSGDDESPKAFGRDDFARGEPDLRWLFRHRGRLAAAVMSRGQGKASASWTRTHAHRVKPKPVALGPDFGATFVRGTPRKPLTWASCG